MEHTGSRVCPMKLAGGLDNIIRRWVHNPHKILAPYVRDGMSALDFGCGPGFFALAMAELVGPSGRVIACDLQEGMLEKLRRKLKGTPLEGRVQLHRSNQKELGLAEKVDFILAFYVLHEVPDLRRLLADFANVAASGARVLVVEPPIHVSARAFGETIKQARECGFTPVQGPKVFFARTVILKKD